MGKVSSECRPDARKPSFQHDVVIIGAGPVGLSLALSLRDSGLRVMLVEKQTADAIENPPFDGREIALSLRSVELLRRLGAWSRIPEEDRSPLRSARVINGRSGKCIFFNAEAVGWDKLGFLVPNHAIRKALFDELSARGHARIMTDSAVTDVWTGAAGSGVTLSSGSKLSARLLVAADTRFSQARRGVGISASMHDFGKTMIVSRVKLGRPHEHIAWECFLPGGAIALLPLNNDLASLVLTFTPEEAARHIEMDIRDYACEAERRLGGRFGMLTPASDRHAYPLVGVYANRFISPGFALVGDAAVGMHPVTAHGYNLGIQGQDLLARNILRAVRSGYSPASNDVLAAYQRDHRRLSAPLYWSTLALAELYSWETPVARLMRKAVFDMGRMLPPARNMILNRLTQGAAS